MDILLVSFTAPPHHSMATLLNGGVATDMGDTV
jgi:hypothetical protein